MLDTEQSGLDHMQGRIHPKSVVQAIFFCLTGKILRTVIDLTAYDQHISERG